MAKSTSAEISKRVSEVSKLLLEGYTRSYILQYASKWKVSDRTIDEYMNAASAQIREVNSLTLQDNLGLVTTNLWSLFREARLAGNLTEQHKLLMSIAKVRGLDQQTINHVIDDKRELVELSDEELDAILTEASH